MSIQQYYLLYTEKPAIAIPELLRFFLEYFKIPEPYLIERYHRADRSWTMFQQGKDDEDSESVIRDLTIDDVVQIARSAPAIGLPGSRELGKPRFAIYDEMRAQVSPEALGDRWGINDVYAHFGERDLIHEDFSTSTFSLHARTRFRLTFESGWIANKPELVDRTFWTLPTVAKIRRDFENVVGPLEQYSWIEA